MLHEWVKVSKPINLWWSKIIDGYTPPTTTPSLTFKFKC